VHDFSMYSRRSRTLAHLVALNTRETFFVRYAGCAPARSALRWYCHHRVLEAS
jgi:hypothetical protein